MTAKPTKTDPRARLDRVRRQEIMLAGWEGDTELRSDLGSSEQAIWEIGACARDPDRVHAYANIIRGKRDQSSWQPAIDEFRRQMTAKHTAPTMREALEDLLSWFDGGKSHYGPWIIKAGKDGADDAIEAARAALSQAEPEPGEPVTLTYTNYRGETAQRTIIPKSVRFGSTEWHPEPQWLLLAYDSDKGADREFALRDFGAPMPDREAIARLIDSDAWHESLPKDGCAAYWSARRTKARNKADDIRKMLMEGR